MEANHNINLCIINLYMPCDGYKTSASDYDDCLARIRELMIKYRENFAIILCGDFNASITCDPRHYQDRALRAFCSEMELIQPESYQDGCTFHHANGSSSQIDYFFIERKHSDIISKVWLPEDSSSNISDHTALLANFNIKKAHLHRNMKEKDQAKATIPPNPRWDKADIPTYQGLIKQRISSLPDQIRGCVDKLLYHIQSTLQESAAIAVPTLKIKGRKKHASWSPTIANLVKKCKASFFNLKQARNNQTGSNAVMISQLIQINREAKKNLWKAQRQDHAKERTKLYDDIMMAEQHDQKLFYKLIRRQRSSSADTKEMRVNGSMVSDDDDIRNSLATYFTNLVQPVPSPLFDDSHKNLIDADFGTLHVLVKDLPDTFPSFVTSDDVRKAIQKLNNKKVADKVGIQAEHIKYTGEHILGPLAMLFSEILKGRRFPIMFKQGMTIPILKKDKSSILHDNYRGITIASTIGKIFEHIILDRLTPVTSALQSDLQKGFTDGSSSIIAALMVSEIMNEAIDTKSELFIASLDARKAFDVVYHSSLMRKLFLAGIDPATWCIINDWYTDLTSQVRWKGELSDVYNIELGVRQGGIFSADNYKSYINPLLLCLEGSGYGAKLGSIYAGAPTCADDVILLANKEYDLQHMLNITAEYANKERYILHPEKSVVMIFNATDSSSDMYTNWSLNDEPLQSVHSFTHLGINRNTKNSSTDINERINLARKTSYPLMGAGLHGVNGISPVTSWKLVNTYVIPRYTYGLEILNMSTKEINSLNQFHKKLLKQIQTLPDRTADSAIFLLLGALPLQATIESRMLNLYGIICRSSGVEREITTKTIKSKSWFIQVSKILNKYNLTDPHTLLDSPQRREPGVMK